MCDPAEESEGEWEEWTEEEEDTDAVKSLFEDHYLPSSEQALVYDADKHGFDLRDFKLKEGLDDYGVIRCINYIRSEVKAGRDPRSTLTDSSGFKPWLDDRYLKPVLQDDGLLFHEYDEKEVQPTGAAEGAQAAEGGGGLAAEVSRLRAANSELQQLVQELLAASLPLELREDKAAGAPSTSGMHRDDHKLASTSTLPAESPSLHNTTPYAPAPCFGPRPNVARPDPSEKERVDSAYFNSYSYLDIHREMLSDKVRTEAYRQALELNPGLLASARVLDVGCGTGILSMFAARGGAKQVVGVEGSEKMAQMARQIVASNGLGGDGSSSTLARVHIVSGKLEELRGESCNVLEAGGKMDVLVSEWMGYALLFESMLDTVLHARDQYLKPGGAVLPDKAVLFLAGASEQATGMDFWKDVYGFNMNVVAEHIRMADVSIAEVGVLDPQHVVTEVTQLQEFDLCHMNPEEQDFSVMFRLVPPAAQPHLEGQVVHCHALALWFTAEFSSRFCKEQPVVLSTSPFDSKTHWAQTLFPLPKPVALSAATPSPTRMQATAKEITGRFSMARSSMHRRLDISIEYKAELSDGTVVSEITSYLMDVIH